MNQSKITECVAETASIHAANPCARCGGNLDTAYRCTRCGAEHLQLAGIQLTRVGDLNGKTHFIGKRIRSAA